MPSDPDVAPIARLQPLNWIRRRQHFNFMQTPEQRCTSPALRNTATGRAVGTGHAHLARQDAAPLPHGGHKCVRLHQIATISISTCPRDIHGRRPRAHGLSLGGDRALPAAPPPPEEQATARATGGDGWGRRDLVATGDGRWIGAEVAAVAVDGTMCHGGAAHRPSCGIIRGGPLFGEARNCGLL